MRSEPTNLNTVNFSKQTSPRIRVRPLDPLLDLGHAIPSSLLPLRSGQVTDRDRAPVKRRSNVVGIFPNDTAAYVSSAPCSLTSTTNGPSARRYLSEASMAELNTPRDTGDHQPQLEG